MGKTSWWEFIDADKRLPVYQKYHGRGITRFLVAMKAEVGSTRTIGYIFLQLVGSLIGQTECFDRVLNGPTNDVFIDPWAAMLKSMGVNFQLQTIVHRFNVPV